MNVPGPLRGISRAAYHASLFVAAFVVVGIAVGLVTPLFFGDEPYLDLAVRVMILHLCAAIILWIPATAVHWIVLRLCRSGARRRQVWRAWPSAVLAVGANWAGVLLILPAVERSRTYSMDPFFAIGLAVFLTNASIAIAWALPPWQRS